MKVFGSPTGSTTNEEIQQQDLEQGDGNILDDAQENGTGNNEEGEGDNEGEGDSDGNTGDQDTDETPAKSKGKTGKVGAKATETVGDDEGDGDEGGDEDQTLAARSAAADELGYDIENLTPKQAKVLDEVMKAIAAEEGNGDTTDDNADDGLTELEREIKAARTTATTTEKADDKKVIPPAPKTDTTNAPIDDSDPADPVKLDPSEHYTSEAQLYADAFDAKLSEPQRKRAFAELREHRAHEFAKDFVRNMKSKHVLNYLREQLLSDVTPKLAQFDKVNATATQFRSRQEAERSAILQLSKLDKDSTGIAEFVKPASNGRPSAYVNLVRSNPKIAARVARLGENPEYASLPADRRAVLHEIDRIRLAHDLSSSGTVKSTPSGGSQAQSRTAKVKAATALVNKGKSISSAAAKAAQNIIAARKGNGSNGAQSNGAKSTNTTGRRFDNPEAERLRIASNKSTSIFGS